jgi:hypothetical protein
MINKEQIIKGGKYFLSVASDGAMAAVAGSIGVIIEHPEVAGPALASVGVPPYAVPAAMMMISAIVSRFRKTPKDAVEPVKPVESAK